MHNRKVADSLTAVLTPPNTMLPKSQTLTVLLRPERSDPGSIHAERHAGRCEKALPCTGSLRFHPFPAAESIPGSLQAVGLFPQLPLLFPAIPTHRSSSARPPAPTSGRRCRQARRAAAAPARAQLRPPDMGETRSHSHDFQTPPSLRGKGAGMDGSLQQAQLANTSQPSNLAQQNVHRR